MNSHFEVRIAIQAQLVKPPQSERKSLRLSIRDYGFGIDDSKPLTMGIGLRNTAERLERLYAGEQSLKVRNAAGGGALVEICMPFQVSEEERAAPVTPVVAAPGVG
ncbi:MAG: hypothetical protein JO210_17295 [Acidobacteriaceae bacterium]|nr:hypothetical protein [Acidobacteriaceae bacterium]